MKRTFFGKTATAQFKIHDEFNAKSQNTDSLNKHIHVYILAIGMHLDISLCTATTLVFTPWLIKIVLDLLDHCRFWLALIATK